MISPYRLSENVFGEQLIVRSITKSSVNLPHLNPPTHQASTGVPRGAVAAQGAAQLPLRGGRRGVEPEEHAPVPRGLLLRRLLRRAVWGRRGHRQGALDARDG